MSATELDREPVPRCLVEPTADGVLAALDPEQREVATTLARPGLRARRRRHRQDPGDHPPDRLRRARRRSTRPQHVLAVTFTARAAGEMRGRLRDARRRRGAGAHLPRRRAAPAAVLLAAGGRRRRSPRSLEHKARWWRRPPRGCGCRSDRTAVRDLAAEIEWAKVSLLTARRLPGGRAAGRSRAARRLDADHRRPAATRRTSRSSPTAGVIDFEDVLLLTVGLLRGARRRRREVREQYRHFVVDEYQDVIPLQQRLLELWLGDRDELCVVGDPSQTIYSFAGATPDHLLELRPALPRAPRWSGWSATTAPPRRSSRWPTRCSPALPAGAASSRQRRCSWSAQRPPGPAPRLREYADDAAEAAAVAAAVRPAGRRRRAGRARSPCCSAPTRQSQACEQALADAGVPYLVRGGERFFDRARGPRGDPAAAGRGPRPATRRTAARRAGARTCWPPAGWTPEPPRQRWRGPRAVGVAAARSPRWPTSWPRPTPEASLADLVAELDERAAAQHAPTVRGRHARLAARGQGPGVGRRVPGRAPDGHAADLASRDAEPRSRRSGGCCTSASPGPASGWSCPGRGPRARRPRQPQAVPVPGRPARLGAERPAAGAAGGRAWPARQVAAGACRTCGRP